MTWQYLYSILFCIITKVFTEEPIISLPNGKIRGKLVQSGVNPKVSYYAYQGIPFAAPPVGNLRFQPPQPVENWENVKDVYNNEISCHQTINEDEHVSEDCLYLSVYTPNAPLNASKLSVLVFIYGGQFVTGHMSYGYGDPAFLIENDIVHVSFNYRLGPFGFLSTEDDVIPGNMGLKDQQFALKWIQENIHLFGGDPSKVTIMGQSAGAASATYHMLAPGSKDLFRAVISCSGTALCYWAHQRNAAARAYKIAAEIDPSFSTKNSTKELLQFLQSVDAKDIQKTGLIHGDFSPVIEIPHDGAFISQLMYDNADSGHFHRVPVLMGFNSEESIYKAINMTLWLQQLKNYDMNPQKLINRGMYIDDNDVKIELGNELKRMYVGNESLEDNPGKSLQFSSDNDFTRSIIKLAELLSEYVDIYFYEFSYHGLLGGNPIFVKDAGRVCHGEEQRYFWAYLADYSQFPASDITTLQRYTKLLINFIKTLNPTPEKDELFQNITWPTISKDHLYYLDIDNALKIRENPRKNYYSQWTSFYEKYVKKPFISY